MRFSRRSQRSSSCSSVVRPSLRVPASRSACLSHSRSVSPVKPSSRAICARGFPLVRGNRIVSARNSEGYGAICLAIRTPPRGLHPKPTGVHQTGSTPLYATPVPQVRLNSYLSKREWSSRRCAAYAGLLSFARESSADVSYVEVSISLPFRHGGGVALQLPAAHGCVVVYESIAEPVAR